MLLRSGTVVQRIDEQGIQLRLEFVFKGIVAQLRIGQHGIDIHRGDELIALVVKEMQHGTQLTAHFHGLNACQIEEHTLCIGGQVGVQSHGFIDKTHNFIRPFLSIMHIF